MVSAPINRYINDEQLAQSVAQMLAREAGAVAARDVAIIPLYHQVVTWAMKKSHRLQGAHRRTLARPVFPPAMSICGQPFGGEGIGIGTEFVPSGLKFRRLADMAIRYCGPGWWFLMHMIQTPPVRD
jgi:hypothetical protein